MRGRDGRKECREKEALPRGARDGVPASPMLTYSSAGAGGGLPRRGSGAVPLVVFRIFPHVPECHLEPLLRTARSFGHRSSHHTATLPPRIPTFSMPWESRAAWFVMGMEDQERLRRTDKGKAQRGQIPSDGSTDLRGA